MRLMSISRVGRASRITISGTSVCPPAITRALSSAASHAQASSMSAAREYSNGAAFMKRYAKPGCAIVLLCPVPTAAPRGASVAVRYCRSVTDMVKVPIALSQPQNYRFLERLRAQTLRRGNGRQVK